MVGSRHSLDAEALELLGRAEGLIQEQRPAEAALVCERAGDRFLSRTNTLGAAAAYQRALRHLMHDTAHSAAKHRISSQHDRALADLAMADGASQGERIRALYRAAALYWSDRVARPQGHGGLCFRCAAQKPAVWLRCEGCRTLPRYPDEMAVSLLLSERIGTAEIALQRAACVDERHEHGLLKDVAGLFAGALSQLAHHAGAPAAAFVPGTIVTSVDAPEQTAVLLEVSTSLDLVDKDACNEFIQSVCSSLLAADPECPVDDLSWADGNSVSEARAQLERRFGSRISFDRWRKLHVESGAVATATISNMIPDLHSGRSRRPDFDGNHAASAVALEAAPAIASRSEIRDFAGQLAHAVALTDFAAKIPGFAELELRTGVTYDVLGRRLDLLLGQCFDCDPSSSVAEAVELLSQVLGGKVTITAAARFVRKTYVDEDPSRFPGAAAQRA